ncbi:MAG TPA: hypothetical protein VN026_00185 [Bacteroidia bacterium]|nr:hypothetical protein [Bacteroidia bacterium]
MAIEIPKVLADQNGWVHCCFCKGYHRYGSGVGVNEAKGERFPDCAPKIEYFVVPYSEHLKELNLPYIKK